VLERRQREPQRGAGDADPLDEGELDEPLTGPDLAVEEQLPERERGLDRLRAVAAWHPPTIPLACNRSVGNVPG